MLALALFGALIGAFMLGVALAYFTHPLYREM